MGPGVLKLTETVWATWAVGLPKSPNQSDFSEMHLVYATWCLLDAALCQHQVCIFAHIEALIHGLPALRYRGPELAAGLL